MTIIHYTGHKVLSFIYFVGKTIHLTKLTNGRFMNICIPANDTYNRTYVVNVRLMLVSEIVRAGNMVTKTALNPSM